MNLRERKVRMLDMDFVRAPTVRDMVQYDFDNLRVCIIDPCPPFGVTVDMARCGNGGHGFFNIAAKLLRIGAKDKHFRCILIVP